MKNRPPQESGNVSPESRRGTNQPKGRSIPPAGPRVAGVERRFADTANGYGRPSFWSRVRHGLHLVLPFLIILAILGLGALVVVFLLKRDRVESVQPGDGAAQRLVEAGPEALAERYVGLRGGLSGLRSRGNSLRSLGGVIFEEDRRYLIEGEVSAHRGASFVVDGGGLVNFRLQSVDGQLSGQNPGVNLRLLDPGLRWLLGLLSEYYDPLERIALEGARAGRVVDMEVAAFGGGTFAKVMIEWSGNGPLRETELYLDSERLRVVGRRDRWADGSDPLFRFSRFRVVEGREIPESVHVELGGGLAARAQISRVSEVEAVKMESMHEEK